VAFPTETVYGLGARALDAAALAKVFEAKGRPRAHPLIAHVADEAQAVTLAAHWPERASRLARAFWPGPLTLVVARGAVVPLALTGGADTVAVRAPSHPVARAILVALGEPIAAPSANRYQELSPTTAAHVQKSLAGSDLLLLDGGPCPAGIESTVVDVTTDPPRVLRPGAVDLAALRAVVPEVAVTANADVAADVSRPSPGMDPRHYAPRARLIVADTIDEAQRIACGLAATGAKVGLVLHTPRAPDSVLDLSRAPQIVLRNLPEDPHGFARELFGTLHDMDDAKVDAIVVERVPDGNAWWAVADRLRRGASPRG
jgi:L-threonylcarbamoyladenylate synthase